MRERGRQALTAHNSPRLQGLEEDSEVVNSEFRLRATSVSDDRAIKVRVSRPERQVEWRFGGRSPDLVDVNDDHRSIARRVAGNPPVASNQRLDGGQFLRAAEFGKCADTITLAETVPSSKGAFRGLPDRMSDFLFDC